jgi:hypothetical protein
MLVEQYWQQNAFLGNLDIALRRRLGACTTCVIGFGRLWWFVCSTTAANCFELNVRVSWIWCTSCWHFGGRWRRRSMYFWFGVLTEWMNINAIGIANWTVCKWDVENGRFIFTWGCYFGKHWMCILVCRSMPVVV